MYIFGAETHLDAAVMNAFVGCHCSSTHFDFNW